MRIINVMSMFFLLVFFPARNARERQGSGEGAARERRGGVSEAIDRGTGQA